MDFLGRLRYFGMGLHYGPLKQIDILFLEMCGILSILGKVKYLHKEKFGTKLVYS